MGKCLVQWRRQCPAAAPGDAKLQDFPHQTGSIMHLQLAVELGPMRAHGAPCATQAVGQSLRWQIGVEQFGDLQLTRRKLEADTEFSPLARRWLDVLGGNPRLFSGSPSSRTVLGCGSHERTLGLRCENHLL